MTVAIVTDSAAAVPPLVAAECGITVVPMWLVSDGEAVREGERTLGELLGDARITTSAPTPGEFEDAIRAELEPRCVRRVGAHHRVGDERDVRRRRGRGA